MKKTILGVCFCLILSFCLTGCGEASTETPWNADNQQAESTEHTHSYKYWEANLDEHWRTCTECGEETDRGPHCFSKDEGCTDCVGIIYDISKDQKELILYDDQVEILYDAFFDKDGKVTHEQRFIPVENEDGTITYVEETE